ncbi:hypothetical protein NliqN6_5696 [Naganishia liquefaciens]|uniref:Arf-GAP domain-containing protein n=1 Tax=Naganishia liquefaciens TaxID=104408 RepID=A0A8H3TY71_9TREE|nr:hypothetical protein NliqN6_5696 [Naganishia liquefaciens]
MSRQDRATTERHAKLLRELVKQPDNKLCADCKKNDARWASWNIGCFVCIRCSGIHRSMGTHISRVKSVDLDIWTPDQIENVKKWGNRRANIYWEAHLKAGHIPPDHKIESFIRSKYESRRWAMRSPVPEDPSVLDDHAQGDGADEIASTPTPTKTTAPPAVSSRSTAGAAPPQPTRVGHPLLSASSRTPKASPAPTAKPPAQAATFDLLGDLGDSTGSETATPTTSHNGPPPAVPGNRPTAAPAAATQLPSLAPVVPAKPAPPAPGAGLFDLDFKAPTPTATAQKPRTSTNDILSLFSTPSAPPVYSQSSVPHQTSYQQPTPTQSQHQAAVFGQAGSYNAPPTIAPQGQEAYATWTGTSAVTSTSPRGITSGMSNLSMGGADVWGASVPNAQSPVRAPTATSPYTAQPLSQTTSSYAPNPSHNYFSSSQDVWGNGSTANVASNGSSSGGITSPGGFDSFGGAPATAGASNSAKQMPDPFANIWK